MPSARPHPAIPLLPAGLLTHNLRRLMAKFGMTYDDLVEASGLDARTIRGIVQGAKQPHAKTLGRLAEALGVSTEELFKAPQGMTAEAFDAATNPLVAEAMASCPARFENWRPEDFAELRSRFGVGGALTTEGVLAEAEALDEKRRLVDRARVVLETAEAPLLAALVNLLYDRVTEPAGDPDEPV